MVFVKIVLCLCSYVVTSYFFKFFLGVRRRPASALPLLVFIIFYSGLWRVLLFLPLILFSPAVITRLLNSFRRSINNHLFLMLAWSLRSIALFFGWWIIISILLFFWYLLRLHFTEWLIIILIKGWDIHILFI